MRIAWNKVGFAAFAGREGDLGGPEGAPLGLSQHRGERVGRSELERCLCRVITLRKLGDTDCQQSIDVPRLVHGNRKEGLTSRAPAPAPARTCSLIRGPAGFTCRGRCELSTVALVFALLPRTLLGYVMFLNCCGCRG